MADVRDVPDLPRYTTEFQFWFFHMQRALSPLQKKLIWDIIALDPTPADA